MITRSKSKIMNDKEPLGANTSDSETSKNQNSMCSNKNNNLCPKFSAQGNLDFLTWLKLFDHVCDKHNLDDAWKLTNFDTFLEGEALTFYINHCLKLEKWEEIKIKFLGGLNPVLSKILFI